MKVRRPINGHHALLTAALSLVLMGVVASPSALGQTLESRVEDLEAHDEILRSRQEVLTSDVSDFKADVAEATAALRAELQAEIAAEGAAVRADMATEDSAIRAEMASEDTAIRAEMHALNSLAAADGSPAQAVYVDSNGRVGIGTMSPSKKLHVAGDAILSGTVNAHTFRMGGEKPFLLRWFQLARSEWGHDTLISAADYTCVIAGFRALNGDIEENDPGNIIQVYTAPADGTWRIYADFRSHYTHEYWIVGVLAIKKDLVDY